MNRLILLLFLFSGFTNAQSDMGFLQFKSDGVWIISINDTLTITSEDTLKLPAGNYTYKAQPQITYTWPAMLINDFFEINSADTTIVTLSISEIKSEDIPVFVDSSPSTVYSPPEYNPTRQENTTLKTGLVVTAVAANWLSFYFKRQADDYYDKYKSSSKLSKINYNYDKTKQFDTLSNIMLGLSASALGTYIYFSLTE